MFRTTLMFILVLSLTNSVFAEDRSEELIGQDVVSSSRNEALEIMQDHMRSQLDWRSYFTNRMDARRRAKSSADALWAEPQAASAN